MKKPITALAAVLATLFSASLLAHAAGHGEHGPGNDPTSRPAEILNRFPGIDLAMKRVSELSSHKPQVAKELERALQECVPVSIRSANPQNLLAAVSLERGLCRIYYFPRFFREATTEQAQAEVTLHEAIHFATRFDWRYSGSSIDDRVGVTPLEIDVQVMARALVNAQWPRFEKMADSWQFSASSSSGAQPTTWQSLKSLYEQSAVPDSSNLGNVRRECSFYRTVGTVWNEKLSIQWVTSQTANLRYNSGTWDYDAALSSTGSELRVNGLFVSHDPKGEGLAFRVTRGGQLVGRMYEKQGFLSSAREVTLGYLICGGN